MTLIDVEKLRKYPFRYDNYDRKNGSPHFIAGGESVLEYAENLPQIVVPPNEPLTFEALCAMAKRREPVWCCDGDDISAGILCWRNDWSNVPERAANIWLLDRAGGCGIYLVMEFIAHGAKFYKSKPEGT